MAATAAPHRRSGSHSSDSTDDSDGGSSGFVAVNERDTPPSISTSTGKSGLPLKNGIAKSGPNLVAESDHSKQPSFYEARIRADDRGEPLRVSHTNKNAESVLHKRKRSSPHDVSGYSPSRYNYSPPRRQEQHQHMADRALRALGNSEDHNPPRFPRPSNDVDRHGDSDVWPEERPVHDATSSRQDPADVRLAEVLQHATHDSSLPTREWPAMESSYGDQDRHDMYASDQQPHMSSSGQSKRKRNFSNRTKTGCLTCRRRKKKCDEQHPICNNCQRGGFACQGYNASRGTWKHQASKNQIPLQSKEGYADVSDSQQGNSTSPDSKHPGVELEGEQSRPIAINDGVTNYTSSPQATEPRSRGSYPGQPWPQHGHVAHNNSDHLPPFSEFTRPEQSRSEHSGAVPGRDMSRPVSNASHQPPASAFQTGQWQGPPQPEYRSSYHPHRLETGHNQPPRASLLAYQSGPRTFTQGDVEKSKMLRGAQYNHFDNTLKNERNRCQTALRRFNNACDPQNGLTEEHAEELLRQVLDPSLDSLHRPIVPCKEQGLLGPGVKVEGPFTCTYGYNLQMFDNVYIGHDCNIDDAAAVRIGARTWIGPNVTVFTSDVSKDMIDRKGTEGRWMAKPVIIGDEVIIGRNAIIFPGVHLGRGSTVEPFAVVKSSLLENQRAVTCPGSLAQY